MLDRRLRVHVVGDLQLLSKNQRRGQPDPVHEDTILRLKTINQTLYLTLNDKICVYNNHATLRYCQYLRFF